MRVLTAGYFDGLHYGHIQFLRWCSEMGELRVALGSDARLRKIKRVEPLVTEAERVAAVKSLRFVADAFIIDQQEGEGGVVWEDLLDTLKPDVYAAGGDLSSEWETIQRAVCERHGVRFVKLPRIPGFSSTALRRDLRVPYRVVLSTWMDQQSISKLAPGPCVGFGIEPTRRFEDRCGMATSTRKTISRIWPHWRDAYAGKSPLEAAKIVFGSENPPDVPIEPAAETLPWGTYAHRWITGAIDPITILTPGVSLCNYSGKSAWPAVQTITREETLAWLESVVTLIPTSPRPEGEHFSLAPTVRQAGDLAKASWRVWDAINNHDLKLLREAVRSAMESIRAMSGSYAANGVAEKLRELAAAGIVGFPQGAGCGGYIACIRPEGEDAGRATRIPVEIRRLA